MRILVFGKTGQLAQELMRRAPVMAFGRHQADLAVPGMARDVIAAARPDLVINASAYTAVDRAEEEQAQAWRLNAEAPGEMALACADRGVPFVHASTDYVFDGRGRRPRRIEEQVTPINAYGRSKLAGETAIREAAGRWAVLRTSWVFSAHGQNFVRTMLRLSDTHPVLSVVDDQVGGPTPAGDLAGAMLSVGRALAGGHPGGLYHYAGAPEVSWAGFAREIFARTGRDVQVTPIATADYPTPAARPANSRLDCSDIARDFGLTQPDWRSGLDRVLDELKAVPA